MRAIIIAAGNASRWGNYMNTPKHLVEINGEPILHRAVRLLNERGITDVYIVGPNEDRYRIPGSSLYVPIKNPKHHDADKFLNSESLWNPNGRTIVLYGDVYFTENAMDTIVSYTKQDWTLFCRFDKSSFTGSPYGECFAQSFYSNDIDRHRSNLLYIADLKEHKKINRCGGWEHYRAMQGLRDKDVRDKHENHGNAVIIDDWTEDFDYPKDYVMWIANWNKN